MGNTVLSAKRQYFGHPRPRFGCYILKTYLLYDHLTCSMLYRFYNNIAELLCPVRDKVWSRTLALRTKGIHTNVIHWLYHLFEQFSGGQATQVMSQDSTPGWSMIGNDTFTMYHVSSNRPWWASGETLETESAYLEWFLYALGCKVGVRSAAKRANRTGQSVTAYRLKAKAEFSQMAETYMNALTTMVGSLVGYLRPRLQNVPRCGRLIAQGPAKR